MKKALFLCAMLFNTALLLAQQTTALKGRVVGNDSLSLPGATVTCINIAKSTATDANGMFALNGLPATAGVTLKFSYTGFTTLTKVFDLSNSNLNGLVVTLKDDALSLNEVEYFHQITFSTKG